MIQNDGGESHFVSAYAPTEAYSSVSPGKLGYYIPNRQLLLAHIIAISSLLRLGINHAYGQAGIYGDVGINTGVILSPYEQVAYIVPRTNSGGWAAAWIGVYLGVLYADIGVVRQVNFFTGELRGYVRGVPSYTQGSPTSHRLTAGLDTTVSALNGLVLGFLRGCVWFFGWHCSQWYVPLFSWSGWHYHGPILYWERTFY